MVDTPVVADAGCSGCGKAMQKAKKVYRGERYCQICYPRLFKRRLCPSCGEYARLPKIDKKNSDPKKTLEAELAICPRCVAAQPCVRCKRTGRPVGRLTPYGPACNSCAHYFTEPRPCEVCHVLSTRLVRKHVDGQLIRCCSRCGEKSSGTCPSCRRHRVLVSNQHGGLECKRCVEMGKIDCETCASPMPAGRGRECEHCYQLRTFRKRSELNLEGLTNSALRDAFAQYSSWLISKTDPVRAAQFINKHWLFFEAIDKRWDELPRYEQLLDAFGVAGMARYRLPMRWLVERCALKIDETLKTNVTERGRIDAIISEVPTGRLQQLLRDYEVHLCSSSGRRSNSLRSVRMAMRSAANLINCTSPSGTSLPTSATLKKLLDRTPGVAASLKGFVSFLNSRHGLRIDFPKDDRGARSFKRRQYEQRLRTMFTAASNGEDVLGEWPSIAVAYFHSIPRPKPSEMVISFSLDRRSIVVTIAGQDYWIPSPPMMTAK